MTNTKLTDGKIAVILARAEICDDSVLTDYADIVAAMRELQERRKAAKPELNPANLVNKFYERYPLASFRDDGFRAAALGYFMAGAELQCFGEFVKYEELCGDE
ncbi:hypothetical protein FI208_06700 [Salmonella enterica subsp. enterica]|nr:hypothetical protein [Salmonella enterica subsp. enterica serovar Lagos]